MEQDFQLNGYQLIEGFYNGDEVAALLNLINDVDTTNDTFRKMGDLFAIRQFLRELPATASIIFNDKLRATLSLIFGTKYFVVKSIYFDKPSGSNWYVSYHQDLTISVDKRVQLEGFNRWTTKQNQFAVQPPLEVLENLVTIRIHLDDTNEENGALKVLPGSHLKGIYRPEIIDWKVENEISCNLSSGGIMLMKPLLLHRSGRTTNNCRRRVIHIEFSSVSLPSELEWAEQMDPMPYN